MLNRTRMLVALAGGALVLSSCGQGSSGAQSSVAEGLTGNERALYEAAVEEPSITWYSSHVEQDMLRAVEAFQEKYPDVRVEALRLTSGQLATRFAQEQAADAPTADIISTGDTRLVFDGVEQDWFMDLQDADLPALESVDEQWLYEVGATVLLTPYGICYNSELLANPPGTWEDILAPEYKGRIVFPDFRNASVYVWAGQVWLDAFGEDFIADLAAQELQTVDSMLPGIQFVGNGQADMGIACPPATAQVVSEQGAPVEVTFPDPVIAVPHELVITKRTESPNTAKLFFNFLMTEEGQEAFVATGASSPIGSEGSVPVTDNFVWPDFDRYDEVAETMGKYL